MRAMGQASLLVMMTSIPKSSHPRNHSPPLISKAFATFVKSPLSEGAPIAGKIGSAVNIASRNAGFITL